MTSEAVVVNRFAVNDVLEINLGTHEEPDWIPFWDFPIRDAVEVEEAKGIVYGRGFYSKEHEPRREFRSVSL